MAWTCSDVYDVADFFLLPALKTRAIDTFRDYLNGLSDASDKTATHFFIIDMVRVVYNRPQLPDASGKNFRDIVLELAHEHRAYFHEGVELEDLLTDVPQAAIDLLLLAFKKKVY